MTDYISREALLERIDDIWDCADMVFEPNDHCCRADDCASCKWAETKKAIRKIIANFPAADVRPVVRATWKRIDYKPCGHDYECSSCGWKNDMPTHFCPNCGADMREKAVRSLEKCKLYKDCEYRTIWNCCCEDCNLWE